MYKKTIGMAAALIAAAALAAPAQAATVMFTDNFNGSGYNLNTAPPGWDVIAGEGTVDWVADNTFSIRCIGNTGGCVDLDGSTSNAGIMTKGTFTLNQGVQYILTGYISPNQRNTNPEALTFGFRTVAGVIGEVDATGSLSNLTEDPSLVPPTFQLFTLVFTPNQTYTGVSVFFSAVGGDNIGPILDNVKLEAVPLPAAAWLLLSGLAGFAALGRRKTNA